jgi:hypothetical protein
MILLGRNQKFDSLEYTVHAARRLDTYCTHKTHIRQSIYAISVGFLARLLVIWPVALLASF